MNLLRCLSDAKIANTDPKSRILKLMRAGSILSFQKVVNARANVKTVGIHGIQRTIGSVLTEYGKIVKEENNALDR